jgi:hypothetical protein
LTLAITDVAGPPAPPERFSSLPIRGADAAAGSANGSVMEDSGGMARVFEILTENRAASRRIDNGNMGWRQAHRKHANTVRLRLAACPKPGPATA